MRVHDRVQANQLLGRIAYFHVMFFEPMLSDYRPSTVQLRADDRNSCCRHTGESHARHLQAEDQESAWRLLSDIARTLPATRSCDGPATECCPCCAIEDAARAIALCWQELEARAYGVRVPPGNKRFAHEVGHTLAAAYCDMNSSSCAKRSVRSDVQQDNGPTNLVLLPLSAELLQVWRAFRSGDALPIENWLNHCSTLNDVAAVVKAQGGR